ncbi:MAG: hypothetical protein IT457_04925 [Planctomycetes bacterium]|nr:hypothetical protein [Planctomycetota bacterium]
MAERSSQHRSSRQRMHAKAPWLALPCAGMLLSCVSPLVVEQDRVQLGVWLLETRQCAPGTDWSRVRGIGLTVGLHGFALGWSTREMVSSLATEQGVAASTPLVDFLSGAVAESQGARAWLSDSVDPRQP